MYAEMRIMLRLQGAHNSLEVQGDGSSCFPSTERGGSILSVCERVLLGPPVLLSVVVPHRPRLECRPPFKPLLRDVTCYNVSELLNNSAILASNAEASSDTCKERGSLTDESLVIHPASRPFVRPSVQVKRGLIC